MPLFLTYPAPKRNTVLWAKALAAGLVVSVGCPWLIFKLVPGQDEQFEQLAKKLTPAEKSVVFERKRKMDEAFDQHVTKLKQWSKSDRPIWTMQKEEYERDRVEKLRKGRQERKQAEEDAKARKAAVREAAGLPPLPPI